MRVFNEDKTLELKECDLTLGYTKEDELITVTVEEASEDASSADMKFTTIKDNEIIESIVSTVEYDGQNYIRTTIEKILVYIAYSDAELHNIAVEARIVELKELLAATDYQAIKYAEGVVSDEEYAPIKAQRQAWRDEINALELEVI